MVPPTFVIALSEFGLGTPLFEEPCLIFHHCLHRKLDLTFLLNLHFQVKILSFFMTNRIHQSKIQTLIDIESIFIGGVHLPSLCSQWCRRGESSQPVPSTPVVWVGDFVVPSRTTSIETSPPESCLPGHSKWPIRLLLHSSRGRVGQRRK